MKKAKKTFGVGIVGLQPERSWAAVAHIPALRALPGDFEIVGVANTSLASAEAAAKACGLPHAFADMDAMLASPEVDIVAVTVKVPHHREIVMAALEAGKHLYCEWPLGNGLAEAEELAALAREKDLVAVIGTQARAAPEIEHLRSLIADGYVGEVLSSTLIGSGGVWGPQINQPNAYTLDPANGATMLTIPFGHTMAAVRDVLGDLVEVSARQVNRRKEATVVETGETIPMGAPDQLLVNGLFANGAPLAVHYRGGQPRGTGFLWEINGTEGDIQVTGSGGHAQMVQLSLFGARGEEPELQPLPVPESLTTGWPEESIPRNVARMYARLAADLRDGTRKAPHSVCIASWTRLNRQQPAAVGSRRITPGFEPRRSRRCRWSSHFLALMAPHGSRQDHSLEPLVERSDTTGKRVQYRTHLLIDPDGITAWSRWLSEERATPPESVSNIERTFSSIPEG